MIHGVYIRNRPKGIWYLMTVSASAEIAKQDKENVLGEALRSGNEEAQARIQTFDSAWFIPESLKEIKEDSKLLYN